MKYISNKYYMCMNSKVTKLNSQCHYAISTTER